MILYRCDRCGRDTESTSFYETELIFTPRDLSGDLDTDHEDRQSVGGARKRKRRAAKLAKAK